MEECDVCMIRQIQLVLEQLMGVDEDIPQWMKPDFRRIEQVVLIATIVIDGELVRIRGSRLFNCSRGVPTTAFFSCSDKDIKIEPSHVDCMRVLCKLLNDRNFGEQEVCSDDEVSMIVGSSKFNVRTGDPYVMEISGVIWYDINYTGGVK